ncbi:synaptosomal-associated protein 47-like [Pseudonaja textilis]|uniref:synaptosomal-associated protein 47-like n=1 Tax=Pseudonaja textilis TaxID=8673 RepID=UPI000EAA776E|nr:synaptosomal-associated protein 47-like [Pseudonaja textilis]
MRLCLAAPALRLRTTSKRKRGAGERLEQWRIDCGSFPPSFASDRLLSELESPSWWPFGGKLPRVVSEAGKAKENPAASPPKSKDSVIVHIPVIIGERTDAHVKPGSLTLLVSGLRICNAKSQLVHWFDKRDVDDVRVQTPYEICVRQRFIGKPDICYRLLSAKMPEAIPFLEVQFSKKIQFSEDAVRLTQAKRVSPEEAGGSSIWQAATGFMGSLVQTGAPPAASSSSSSRGSGDHQQEQQQQQQQQAQVQKEKQVVSQSETQEIRQILRRLKCLALETETELERQDESLDVITSSVDRATMNIDRQNRRIRKLT